MNADILKPIIEQVIATFPGLKVAVSLSMEAKADGTLNEYNDRFQCLVRVESCEIHGWGETTDAALASAKAKFDEKFTPEKLARKAAADELRAKASAIELGIEDITTQ